jgi:hypothetical protein
MEVIGDLVSSSPFVNRQNSKYSGFKEKCGAGLVVRAYNLSTWQVEAGDHEFVAKPRLHSKTLSKNKYTKRKK